MGIGKAPSEHADTDVTSVKKMFRKISLLTEERVVRHTIELT